MSRTTCNICGLDIARWSVVIHLMAFHQTCRDCGATGFSTETLAAHRTMRCPKCKRPTCSINKHMAVSHPDLHACGACGHYVKDDEEHQTKQHWCSQCGVFCLNKRAHDRAVHTHDPNQKLKFSTHKCALHAGAKITRAELASCPGCIVRPH